MPKQGRELPDYNETEKALETAERVSGIEKSAGGRFEKLTGIAGLVTGVNNLLHNFDERIAAEIDSLDTEYETVYLEYLECNAGGQSDLARQKFDELKERRQKILDEVIKILVDNFDQALKFVIDDLSDDLLKEKMKMPFGQLEVINWLYALLSQYQNRFFIGTGISRMIEINSINYAQAKGETVLRYLRRSSAEMPAVKSPTAVIKNTLPPPPMVIGGKVESGKTRFIKTLRPPSPADKYIDEEKNPDSQPAITEKRITQPFASDMGFISPNPPSGEDLDESRRMAEDLANQTRGLSRYNKVPIISENSTESSGAPPDLSDIFGEPKQTATAINTMQTQTTAVLDAVLKNTADLASPEPGEMLVANDIVEEEKIEEERVSEKVDDKEKPQNQPEEKISIPWYQKAWNKAKNVFKNHGRPVLLALGLMAGSSGDLQTGKIRHPENTQPAKPQPVLVASGSAAPSTNLDNAPKVQTAEKTAKNIERKSADNSSPVQKQTAAESEIKKPRTFSKRLTESKSPIVQDIISSGSTKMGHLTVTDTMITAFVGLATDAEKVQLKELQQQINLAIGVYFNENFGTEAKIAAAMKNPRLKNLYRTARVAKEKGWFNSTHTKANFPQAAALAERLFADSAELGLDQSASENANVKAFAIGNMFQAKHPGDTLNFKKADGSYHIIQEMTFQIFEGKLTRDLVRENAMAKTGEVKSNGAEKGKTGVFLPNIIKGGFNGFGSDRSVEENFQFGITRDQQTIKTVNDEMTAIDMEWDRIADNLDKSLEKNREDRRRLEKNSLLEFQLPLEFTTREENNAIIPKVSEELIRLYPEANAEKIAKLVRQYGYIGFKKVNRLGRGVFTVELHPNFQKILNMLLMEKVSSFKS